MPKCGKYAPGKMDKRVAIQSVTRVSDGQGGFTDSWATDATVWANVNPTKGWEKFQAQQTQTPVTHKITIRYRSGITTKQRVLFGSRVFNIKEALNPDEANAFLELQAIEQQ
ncbi:phage head closure protein [Zavarzinella formosa]|uniref:phage head closure protein n=1 Tax=Zavarzinella formosa TaxID=360055 RepID=UPI000311173B|nr:phage head closure protein [Zavarzinella formosa]